MSSPWQKYKENILSNPIEVASSNPITVDILEKTDKETSTNRLNICHECPELVKYNSQCSQCGCFMPTRVEFKVSSCPLGKW
jgi:Family of unknown function (DUF6171)